MIYLIMIYTNTYVQMDYNFGLGFKYSYHPQKPWSIKIDL